MQFLINETSSHTVTINAKRALMPCVILCFAILILIRDVAGVTVNRYIFIALATATFIVLDKQSIYAFIAFLTPLSVGISATYITAIALVIIFIKQKELKVHILGLGCMVLILLMELLSAVRGIFSLTVYFRFAGIFIFAFLAMIDHEKNYDYDKMIKLFVLGYFVAMGSIIGQMLNEYSLEEILSLGIRLGNTRRLLGKSTEGMLVSYNANDLGALCLLNINFCILLRLKTGNKWYMASFVISSLLGLMTQSRAFLICYVISVLLFIFMSSKDTTSIIKNLSWLILGVGAILGLTYWLIPDYMSMLVERFNASDISGGRNEIFAFYFKEMTSSVDKILFGVGLQYYPQKYNYIFSAHNATQEVVIAWGVIGLFIVIALFGIIFRNAKRQNPIARNIQYIPLIMSLAIMQSLQGFSDRASMLRLMIAYFAILMSMSKGPKKEKLKVRR